MNRQVSVGVAVLAMLLNALWPLIAQAQPRSAPAMHAICTVNGIEVVALDDAPGVPAQKAPVSPHCAFCSLGSDRVAIEPPLQVGVGAAPSSSTPVPAQAEPPLPRSTSLSTAQPRAPPYYS